MEYIIIGVLKNNDFDYYCEPFDKKRGREELSKFFIEYETGFWIFKRLIGMELIEAETLEKAYEKCSRRFQVLLIKQVNDDAKPQDFKQMCP
jgi:hypothetical protein